MPGFSPKAIVIDGRGHMLGRLASIVAKLLLSGNKVSLVLISVADPGSGAFLTLGSEIRDEQPGSYFLELRNHFFGLLRLKYLNSLMRIRDGDRSDPGSRMKKSRIRDKHPGSATLVLMYILVCSCQCFGARAQSRGAEIILPPGSGAKKFRLRLFSNHQRLTEKILVAEEVFVNYYNCNPLGVKRAKKAPVL